MRAMRLFPIILSLFIVSALVASAQVPPAPTNLTVQPTPHGIGALLQWQGSNGAAGYKVYRAVDTSTHFQRIATVQTTTFVDQMIMPGHTYHYYVRAFNMAGESGPSNIVTFIPGPPPPRITGVIRGTVTDDSTAQPIRGVQIQFYRPMGMVMHMVWTDSLGRYRAVLDTGRYLIYASKPGYVPEWYDNSPTPHGATPVQVTAGDSVTANIGLSRSYPPPPRPRGTIAGTVIHDSTGLPIPGVRIRFYRTNIIGMSCETRTDSLGMYRAELDTGRYLVYATKYEFIPEYYDNARTPQEATPVPVFPNIVSTANFGLSPVAPLPLVSVSGTVIDSLTGQPIPGAFVAILRTIQGLNAIQHFNGMPGGFPHEIVTWPGFGRLHGVVWHGRTDSSGNYVGRVPAGNTYIVFSMAVGYIGEFFNNKRNPAEADRLTLHNDTSGINFDLVPNPLFQNSIAGSVIDSMNNGVPSRVVLFVRTNIGPRAVMHTVTDTLGNYIFRYVRTGVYLLKALPISGYAPAWYKAGAFGVTDWRDADTVVASGAVTGINIGVVPITDAGFARIVGRVTETNGSAVRAAFVYARSTTTNRIFAYDITDDVGMFTLGYLLPGTYRVEVDRGGYVQQSVPTYTLSSSNNYEVTNASLRIVPWSPTSVSLEEGLPTQFVLYQNYPNPFNPSTAIKFLVPVQSHITIKVLNVLGQEVQTLVSGNYGTGQYEVVWDGQNQFGQPVASGVYFYRLEARPTNGREAFVQVKKMILMK